ncbi:MAG: hypothetical protein WCI02_16125 [Planctomycetota bacterium]
MPTYPPASPYSAYPPTTPSTAYPPASPYSGYPQASPYGEYPPTFRPSTAPTSGFDSTYNSWVNWFTGSTPTNPTFPPPTMPTGFGQPITSTPGFNPYAAPVPGYGAAPYGATAYPPGAFPTSGAFPASAYPNSYPPVMYPGYGAPSPYGAPVGPPPGTTWWYNTTSTIQTQTQEAVRFCQGVRFRYTYLPGNTDFGTINTEEVASNDAEVSIVFAWPKFLGCSQPLYIMPAYVQTLWAGPVTPDDPYVVDGQIYPGQQLPPNAFAAYLDHSIESDPKQTFGGELGFRIGVFSAFNAISNQSIRLQGKALARLRCTPNSTLRGGIYYLDRNKIKLLPAFGVLWTPNQDTRWDIFFPEPTFAHYLTTCGNTDVWWYLTGYYGGGNWTIEQPNGVNDSVDINDIRVMLGFETGRNDLLRQGFRSCFYEVGYAFNRELVYRYDTPANINLQDSLVFRAGFGY